MYAVFETGGKQYKVEAGDRLRIEKLAVDAGEKVLFDKVIAYSDGSSFSAGTPYLDGATVNATVLENGKADKVIIFKFKAKKDYRKKQGHRQPYTEIEIDSFTVDGKTVGEKPKRAPKPKKAEDEKPAKDEAEAKPEKDEEEAKAEAAEAEPVAEAEEAVEAVADAADEAKEEAEEIADEAKEEAVEIADEAKEEAVEAAAEEKPVAKMTKADIMARLDELGAEYAKSAKKDELLAILAEAEGGK
jgi:large subunit ribosomal protein L21